MNAARSSHHNQACLRMGLALAISRPQEVLSEEFLARFEGLKPYPGGWSAICPNHPRAPYRHSDSIFFTPQRTFENCTAACQWEEISKALEWWEKQADWWKYTHQPGDDDGLTSIAVAGLLLKVFPPKVWLVPGLILAKSVVAIIAPPNAGKTFLALDYAAQAVAAGKKVLFVEQEGGEDDLQLRMRRALLAAGVERPPEDRFRYIWNTELSMMTRGGVEQITKEATGFDMVFLDPLASLWPGLQENDPKEMGLVANTLRLLRTQSGAAVIALHHMTKDGWKPEEVPSLRTMRGHGTLAGAVDTCLALKPLPDTAGLVRFELHCVKQRSSERPAPRVCEILMTGSAAVLEIHDIERESETAPELLARLLPLIPEHPLGISVDDLRKVARARPERVREAVNLGDAQGLLGRNRRIGIFRNAKGRTQPNGPIGSDGPRGETVGPLSRPHTTCGSEGLTPNSLNWSDPTSAKDSEDEL